MSNKIKAKVGVLNDTPVDVKIPDGTKTIDENTLTKDQKNNIISVKIPFSVESIGEGAFQKCVKLVESEDSNFGQVNWELCFPRMRSTFGSNDSVFGQVN